MNEITNTEQLEAWLKEHPREDAVLIAARCALRVFPMLAPVVEKNSEQCRTTIILPTLRALSVAGVADARPNSAKELRAVAAAAAANAATAAYAAYDTYAAAASYDAAAAYDAAPDAAPAAAAPDAAPAAAAPNAASYAANAAANTSAAYAAYDAATTAASAANVAAVLWKTIDDDANALEKGWPHKKFNETPLWHAGAPGWIREPWHTLRDHLLSAGDDWFVWVDWYQDRLDGKPGNEDLEVAKALIPDEIWDAGPATLNAEIARLINEHRSGQANQPSTVDVLLERPSRLYALADWALIDQLMQLQPFDSDYLKLDDLSTIRARDQLLEQLVKQAEYLRDDVSDEGYNDRWATRLIRSLDRYFDEAAKTARHAIPGLLMKHGSDLRDCFLNEETASKLPDSLRKDLEAILDLHSRLVQSYLTPTLARMQGLADLKLPDRATPELIVDLVERAVAAIQNNALGELHDADDNGKAVLQGQADSLRDLKERRDEAKTDAERERLDDQIKKEGTTTIETIIQLVARSAKAKADFTGYLANLKTLLDVSFQDVWGAILEVFKSW